MAEKKKAYFYLIVTLSAWGSLYVASKFVLSAVPTFTLLCFRYVIASSVLFIVLKNKKVGKIDRSDYWYIFLIGFIGYFISVGSQFLGTKFANASIASLINSTNPIFITALAVIFLREKLTLNKIICIVLALIGTIVILGNGNLGGQVIGVVFSFIAVLSWSIMSIIVKKVTSKYDAIQITTYALFIALLCSIPCSVFELTAGKAVIHLNGQVIMFIFYIAIVCTAIPHVLWNKSLSILEAGRCSMFYPLQPLCSVILGIIFLGEKISIGFIIGTVMIISGILFCVKGDKAK